MSITEGWHHIRNVAYGFGYRKDDEKVIFLRDTKRFLKITDLNGVDLDKLYVKLQPLKEAWLEKRRQEPRHELKSIRIPIINREYPKL